MKKNTIRRILFWVPIIAYLIMIADAFSKHKTTMLDYFPYIGTNIENLTIPRQILFVVCWVFSIVYHTTMMVVIFESINN